MAYKPALIFCILLLSIPAKVGGGYICYASCLVAVGGGGFIAGAAILPVLGFTAGGITAGSWAAAWMASYTGVVPVTSLLAFLQSIGAAGVSWTSYGSAFGICSALCAGSDYITPRDDDSKCENGWKSYGNNCYLFELNKLKWHGAKKECERRNSHLVKIDNSAENSWLGSKVLITGINGNAVWIGANDLIEEGLWTWVSDYSIIGYSNWAKGEPNNDRGVEDCGQLCNNRRSFSWNDAACSDRHEYICEKMIIDA